MNKNKSASFSFYSKLPVLTTFESVLDSGNYHSVPEDWHIVITDVIDSTGAIESGRYKEVNTAGCLAAMAISNITNDMDFPFLFDGDGMKYLVPQDLCSDVEEILLDTRRAVRDVLALELRVGLVSVVEVYGAGHTLAIARLGVSDRYTQVMISGTGLEYAESLVKGEATQERFLLPANREPRIEADFTGYTCRWEDIPSSKGETIALIVKAGPNVNQQVVFQELLEWLNELFGRVESYHPLSEENIHLARSGDRVESEAGVRSRSNRGFFHFLFVRSIKLQNWFLDFLIRHNINFWFRGKNLRDVRKDNVLSSDFRKYDGMLKMVISASPENRRSLKSYLEEQRKEGRLFYGLHVSNRALLTCLIQWGSQNEVHFVDAADGGYALAAKELKKQIAGCIDSDR